MILVEAYLLEVQPSYETGEDELRNGASTPLVQFLLPSGSYAAVVLREFMKTDPLNY
jgi:tRNA(Glu) U13 pseudouridine synthase TruD